MDWDPAFLSRSPMFEPLIVYTPVFGAGWPRLLDLRRRRWLRADIGQRSFGGIPRGRGERSNRQDDGGGNQANGRDAELHGHR